MKAFSLSLLGLVGYDESYSFVRQSTRFGDKCYLKMLLRKERRNVEHAWKKLLEDSNYHQTQSIKQSESLLIIIDLS